MSNPIASKPRRGRGRPRKIQPRRPDQLARMPGVRVLPSVAALLADAQTIAGAELANMRKLQETGGTASARDLKDLVGAIKESFLLERELIEAEDLTGLGDAELEARLLASGTEPSEDDV